MRPIRVLDLRDTYEVGGPGKTILETYRAIDRRAFELHLGVFLTRREPADSPFLRAARALGMPLHIVRGHNQYDPRMVWRLARLVKSLGIDIVHAHEVKSDVLAYLASRIRRVSIVTTLHGWFGHTAKHRLFIALDRLSARRFDCVIAVSAEIRDEMLRAGVRPDRLRLLHNAIVPACYERTGRRGFLRELIGRQLQSPVIVSIGRISPEKGHADLVEALAIVASRGRRFSAVLAGNGPDRASVRARIRERGLQASVHLPGYVSEPQRLLEESDLMVLPSHTEGLPNAALEALAMQVPVLATSVGGTPEVIVDGETGYLVPPRSPEALAARIEQFLNEPSAWKRTAIRGREVVRSRFDFQTRTRGLEAIYREMLGGRG